MYIAEVSAAGEHNVTASAEGLAAAAAADLPVDAAAPDGKKPKRRRKKADKSSSTAQIELSRDKLMHICDFTECRLPAEDWYVHSKAPRT